MLVISNLLETLPSISESELKLTAQPTQEQLNTIFNYLPANGKIHCLDTTAIRTSLILSGFTITSDTTAIKPAYTASSVPLLKSSLKPAVWKITDDDEDDEGIDEDDLLDDEDLARPAEACVPDAKKKACKDCTCGLAEEQAFAVSIAAVEIVKSSKELPKSSCGSCYLGDAFRCASCPYAGMPAFEKKDNGKISLLLSDDI